MADQAKFLSFLDMIDGGGAGKMGDKFEGGGIFSAIANMIAKPYGSEDEGRKRARMRALGLLDTQPAAAPAPVGRIGDNAPKPMLRPKMRPSAEDRLMGMPVKPMSAEDRLMGMPVQPNQMYTQAAAERGMGLDPFGGAGPVVSDPRGFAPNTQPSPVSGVLRQVQQQAQTAPVSGVAPNVSMSADPMIGGTRNPSAYRPIAPMPEMQPSVDTSSFGLMPYEQFVPYITNLYKKEMGTNAMLSNDQLQSAYQAYRRSMGIGM